MSTKKMGRPPKQPEERRTNGMRIPLTDAEQELVEDAALVDDQKPITWARNVLLRSAKRKLS